MIEFNFESNDYTGTLSHCPENFRQYTITDSDNNVITVITIDTTTETIYTETGENVHFNNYQTLQHAVIDLAKSIISRL